MTAQAAAVTVVPNPVLAQPHLGLVPTLTVQHLLSLLMADGSLISSPVSKCTRHKQKSSGHCCPSSRSHSWTPTTGSQAMTIIDDKDQSPSPKRHHKSHKKHKKCEHNSPSHSPLSEKLHLSHSSRKKSSSKAASAACKGSPTSCCCPKCDHS